MREAVTRYHLQESNKLLIAAPESARDGILHHRSEGEHSQRQQGAENMTGYGRET